MTSHILILTPQEGHRNMLRPNESELVSCVQMIFASKPVSYNAYLPLQEKQSKSGYCRLDTGGLPLECYLQIARRRCLGSSYPTLLCVGFCCLVDLLMVVLIFFFCHWHA